ncbi:hypothetical protein SH668x_001511 [Planctomicrobium sp. SH668]|uniref:hypothetical protein n=1 Tax=Planctomicrobium sp. SH668 TaxID=3448126 RepID=UPI003F5B53B7
MTKIAKILAVFVALVSLAFAGFAVTSTFGGPDWKTLTSAEYFQHYHFTQGGAPDYTWTATRADDGNQVAASKRLPEVLVKVMDDIVRRQGEVTTSLNDRESLLQTRVETLIAAKENDEKAIEAYLTVQRERLAAVRKEYDRVAAEVVAATNQAQALQTEVGLRRDDVSILRRQVEELKTEQFRLNALQANLESLVQQVEGDQLRASLRKQGLENQVP